MNKTWNKTINTETQTARKRNIFDGKIKEILLIAALALTLVFAVWKVFYDGDTENVISVSGSEKEQKISLLLKEIDGVGEANVMICETEEGVKSVVVVCEGARDLQVVMNVREAVAAALGTEEKAVKIYLKKE